MFMVLSSWLVIARVHLVHVMDAEQCQVAANLWWTGGMIKKKLLKIT